MSEQDPKDAEQPVDEDATPDATPERAPGADMTRRQHLAAALRGRPILIAAAAITALAVGLGGFGIGYAVGNNHEHGRGDRIGPVVFERDMIPGGPGGEWGRGFPPNEQDGDNESSGTT